MADLQYFYRGKISKRQLKNIIIEEAINANTGKEITIPVPRQPKMTKKSKEAIETIVDDPAFLGGAMEAAIKLGDLPEKDGGVKIGKQLSKKVIKDKKFYWKNTKTPKPFSKKKKKIKKPNARIDFMKKVAYCLANEYEFISFGNNFYFFL